MKKLITLTAIIIGLSLFVFASGTGLADAITDGVNATCPGGVCPTNPDGSIDSLVRTIIDVFSWIVGVVSVIMIIYGGFRYVTSGGDSGKVSSAKNTILYAIIGLIIVALAQVIVLFVLGNVT